MVFNFKPFFYKNFVNTNLFLRLVSNGHGLYLTSSRLDNLDGSRICNRNICILIGPVVAGLLLGELKVIVYLRID